MNFRTLSTLSAAAVALSVSVSARAQVSGLPSFGLQTLGLSGSLLSLPAGVGLPTVPSVPGLSLLSLGTLTNLLGTSGLPTVPGAPTLPGLPGTSGGIAGLPSLPGSTDLNGYLVYLNNDLNGVPVPTRLNALFSNSPIPPPAQVPAFPTNLGAQWLAGAGLPVVSDLTISLISLNRTQFVPSSTTGLPVPGVPALPIPGI
jgi:hypothetical protein